MRKSKSLLSAAITCTLLACGPIGGDKYAKRDGEAEALSNFRSRRPLLIYSHVQNGFAPGWASPGLVFCSPSEVGADAALRVFRIMSEASFQEGKTYTPVQQRVAASAVRFARDYNIAVFRHRRAEVIKVCPDVRVELPNVR